MNHEDELTGKRIVIVEDEGVTVMLLRRALTQAGLVIVGAANNGQDAVTIVLREKPDIVLIDIQMPVMNGLEATRQIMANTPTCIVMLTANTDDKTMKQAESYGAAGYIAKPITSEYVIPALKQALQMFYECHP